MSIWLHTACELTFDVEMPTPFILMLRPRSGVHQWVARESYTLQPSLPVVEYTDVYGNLCQRLVAPIGSFSIRTTADVLTADGFDMAPGAPFTEVPNLPDSVLTYLLPSRYCESDRMWEWAQNIVDGITPGYDQVMRITQWVRGIVQYVPGSSNVPVSALEVLQRRVGVCRDLSHLGIALCRSLSIPARMVVGYLHRLQPMDLHAWFEAYVGGRWYTFDPSREDEHGGRVAVAYGRDAADVAVFTQFGPALFPVDMQVHVNLLKYPPA